MSDHLYGLECLKEVEFPIENYEKVVLIDTESILDIPNIKNKLLDSIGDIFNFYFGKKKKEQKLQRVKNLIRKKIQTTIEKLIKEGYSITVHAHSLGTWMLMGTNIKVEKAILMGSPCGINFANAIGLHKLDSITSKLLRFLIFKELQERINENKYLKTDNLIYLYSTEDFIGSKKLDISYLKIFSPFVLIFNTYKGHDYKCYLTFLKTLVEEIRT